MPELDAAADFEVGPQAIGAYSRLNYTMWYALAEFVDNSTQARVNYDHLIDEILKSEGNCLRVSIRTDKDFNDLLIEDNCIGMSRVKLEKALKIAQPTSDSKGRSKYGMGLKTAACWIGNTWTVTTCEWGSGEEWKAVVDVKAILNGNTKIPLTVRKVGKDEHYTRIRISDLNRSVQQRTQDTIRIYLGSMYRMDIREKKLILLYENNPVPLPEDLEFAAAEDGTIQRFAFEHVINGKRIHGWLGVLKSGGRKFGGFSLLQHGRQIRGYPDAWKPRSVFGGVDDEGGNSLVSQRLTGEIILDDFDVSHTKDSILYRGNEEEQLELFLAQKVQKLKSFASTMRTNEKRSPWSKERVKDIVEGAKKEFESKELHDTLKEAIIPPLSVIQETNKKQVAALTKEDMLWSMDAGSGITIRVYLQDRSENDPHLTIVAENNNVVSIVINARHPYYMEIDSADRADELIRQYIYDAVSEYRVFQRMAAQPPDAIRKLKDQLLRAKLLRMENEVTKAQRAEIAKLGINDAKGTGDQHLA